MLLLITLEREKGRMLSLQHFPSSVSLSGIKHLAAIEAWLEDTGVRFE